MNATILAAIGLTATVMLPGEEITPQRIRQFPALNERALVYRNRFDDPHLAGMSLDRCARLAPGEGAHGRSGLRIQCDPTEKGRSAQLELPEVVPGARYVVSFSVRTKDLKFHGPRKAPCEFIAVRQRDAKTGKMAMGKYSTTPFGFSPGEEFKETEYSFVGLKEKSPVLALWLATGWSGTIWFDDVRVYRAGIATTTLFTFPRQNTFFTDSGRFVVHADVPPGIQAAAVVSLEKDGKTLKEQVVLADDHGNLRGDLGAALPLGAATVRVLLADGKEKRLLNESAFPVTIRAKQTAPSNAAILDEHDRLILDGKPCMPLGLYFSGSDPERELGYPNIAEAGFNCVLDYGVLAPSKQEPDRLKAAAGRLDLTRRCKLKQIFNVINLHKQGTGVPGKDLKENDRAKATEKLIGAFKDHPALMGWYISDEMPLNEMPEVIKVKDHINALDPWHPVVTLTNKPTDLPQYALSGNIFMPDAYPLWWEKSRDVGEYLHVGMAYANRSGLPVWAVPQAFSWGIYSAETAEDYQRYYLPTEEDMRSMALHFAIDGAKGFVFYVYPSPSGIKKATSFGDVNHFDRVWPRVKGMGQAIKLLEPFVTSSKTAPTVAVENRGKALVRALAYTAENGKNCLIVVGCGGASAEAVVTVPGAAHLKSRFGRTENLGGGKYRFTSPELGSDMLFGD